MSINSKVRMVGQRFRTIFSGVQKWAANQAMEGAILGIFQCFTPDFVYEAIVNDWEIWDNDWMQFEQFRDHFKALYRDPRFSEYVGMLNVESVILWLTKPNGLPLHASVVINTPGGIEWLERRLTMIRKGLSEQIGDVPDTAQEVLLDRYDKGELVE